MTLKIFRRGSARCLGLLCAFATILLCLYYISIGQSSVRPGEGVANNAAHHLRRPNVHHGHNQASHHGSLRAVGEQAKCQRLEIADTDITTMAEYSQFEFQVSRPAKTKERKKRTVYEVMPN